ncbi:hypothetical protein [Candidatus Nanohalococcus occultus]|uniref:DUF2283 domain-containing protein n=1 Tax=Candidatus Nanohalococcus occultus TaxID=2978047 RepID=A0ABY8CDR7_9ARCH|nr:hypothetical protein SVXNc_0327 [Candidatus Nanohaloarchaeota archaeon SVXNc]
MDKIIRYDSKEDVLFYNEGRKSKYSVQVGDFVLDVANGSVVGMEVMNATENISFQTSDEIAAEDLEKIIDASISVRSGKNEVFIALIFTLQRDGKEIQQKLTLNLDKEAVEA